MKKTYTSVEIKQLYSLYDEETFTGYSIERTSKHTKTFGQWLDDKEQSELPVKGQMIWVRDNGGEWFTRDYPMWTIHKTHKMISPIAITTSILGAIEVWDEYSLTDPNQ